MNPRVSVVISTYNRAGWLQQAVDSVRAQSFSDYELIIADDGSTDNTEQLVQDMGQPLRYLRLEHSGRPSVARNRALAAARGELVAFLDDDDLWPPDKLERQVRQFESEPHTGMAYGDIRFLRPDGTLSEPVLAGHERVSGMMLGNLIRDCFIYPSTVTARWELVQKAGCFDEALSIVEDYDLWLRLASLAPLAFVAGTPTTIRRHEQNITQHRKNEVARNMVRVLDAVPGYATLSPGQWALLRRRRARARTHLAQLYVEHRAMREARKQVMGALRLNPLQWAAWRTFIRSVGL